MKKTPLVIVADPEFETESKISSFIKKFSAEHEIHIVGLPVSPIQDQEYPLEIILKYLRDKIEVIGIDKFIMAFFPKTKQIVELYAHERPQEVEAVIQVIPGKSQTKQSDRTACGSCIFMATR